MDSESCKNMLLEMGFPMQKVVQALLTTGSTEIGDLINWMEQNEVFEELPIEHDKKEAKEELSSKDESIVEGKIKVYKCKTCAKSLKNEELAALHTSKTDHNDFDEIFEEIKPLTEEEKQKKIEELQKTMEKRRAEKNKQDEEEQKLRELDRRKQGKEYTNIKQKLRQQEALKIAEETKREKMEEKMAKQRIKDLIEKDKQDRMKKFNYAPSQQDGVESVPSVSPSVQPKPSPSASLTTTHMTLTHPEADLSKKDYDTCDLQIRLMDGKVIKHSFGAKEQLAAVRLYVLLHSSLGTPTSLFDNSALGDPDMVPNNLCTAASNNGTSHISLMTPFPKKVFVEEDMGKSLTELGLVPKAVLTVIKAK